MLQWANAFWLLLIPAIVLIRFLHQFKSTQKRAVSSLLFWQKAPLAAQNSTFKLTQTNKIWRLRALIASLIILAASSPHWLTQQHTVHVWIDDSVSMMTQEQNITRAQIGFARLLKKLASQNFSKISIHSLNTRDKPSLNLNPLISLLWQKKLNEWYQTDYVGTPRPLPDALPVGENWLITDTADQRINHWYQNSAIDQLILVGQETENTAFTQFSARPAFADHTTISGLVQFIHRGNHSQATTLQLYSGQKLLKQWRINAPVNQLISQRFEINRHALPQNSLRIKINEQDALPIDNQLTISTTFTLPLTIRGACPPTLLHALHSHPFLHIQKNLANARFNIYCGLTDIDHTVPSLIFHQNKHSIAVKSNPVWLTESTALKPLIFPPQLINYFAPAANINFGKPLYSANQKPLISYTQSPHKITHSLLDVQNPALTAHASFPLLISGLIDFTLDTRSLDPMVLAQRPLHETIIQPFSVQIHDSSTPTHSPSTNDVLINGLICLALMLTATDWLYSSISKRVKGDNN